MRSPLLLLGAMPCVALAACAGGGETPSGGSRPADSDADSGISSQRFDGGGGARDSGADGSAPDGAPSGDADAGPPQPIVYGHTADTLYALDLRTKAVSVVGKLAGCTQSMFPAQVIDLAVDSSGDAFATTFDGFYAVDLTTAACTSVAKGSYTYPNSLSFVPKGTLDANAEALVGYVGSTYVRIDTSTGAVTQVGALSGGYASSGDVVSVSGGGTFLTATGNGCADCLLEVDPKTGDVIQSYGSVGHAAVYGLAFWAGALYGFDEGGDIFELTGGDGGLAAATDLASDAGVKWWGAGSTTSAPVSDADGGTFPIR